MNIEAIKVHELQAKDVPLLSVKQVRMLQETTIPAGKGVTIPVTIEGIRSQNGPLLLEKFSNDFEGTGLEMERSLYQPTEKGETMLTINTSGFMEKISENMVIGEAIDVQPIYQPPKVKANDRDLAFTVAIKQVNCIHNTDKARIQQRKKILFDVLKKLDLPSDYNAHMCELLSDYHDVFALEAKERGETDFYIYIT